MCARLQPFVRKAATLRAPGCNPMCARLQPNVPRWKGRCTLTEGCVWHARHRRKCKVGEIFYVEYEVEEVLRTHLLTW